MYVGGISRTDRHIINQLLRDTYLGKMEHI